MVKSPLRSCIILSGSSPDSDAFALSLTFISSRHSSAADLSQVCSDGGLWSLWTPSSLTVVDNLQLQTWVYKETKAEELRLANIEKERKRIANLP